MVIRSPTVIEDGELERDLATLVLARSGRLVATGNRYEPYRLLDPDGTVVEAAAAPGSLSIWFRQAGISRVRFWTVMRSRLAALAYTRRPPAIGAACTVS